MENETKKQQKPNVNDLLKSKDFNNIVNSIIRGFGNVQDDIKDDIRQVCSISVMRLVEQFDPDRNVRFWTYARPFLAEYAKRELNNQRNTVHIPYNHSNGGFKEYEKIRHEYQDLIMPDGHLMPLESRQMDVTLMIDINDALANLNEMEEKVVKMRIGLIPTNTGKNDFASIGNTVGVTMHKARDIFLKARTYIREYLYSTKK